MHDLICQTNQEMWLFFISEFVSLTSLQLKSQAVLALNNEKMNI